MKGSYTMPRKNTTPVSTNLTAAQIEVFETALDGAEKSTTIAHLIQQFVEANGGTWPAHPTRGKYTRIVADATNTDSNTT